jgi:hypothetical protein
VVGETRFVEAGDGASVERVERNGRRIGH